MTTLTRISALALASMLAGGCTVGSGDGDTRGKSQVGVDVGSKQSKRTARARRLARRATPTPTRAGGSLGGTDPCELLTDSTVRQGIGGGADEKPKTGETLDGFAFVQCIWSVDKRGKHSTLGERNVAVVVVDSPKRYADALERGGGKSVEGLGDAAVVQRGLSTETTGTTSGRTAFVLSGGRTLAVALDRGGSVRVDVIAGTAEREGDDVTVAEVTKLARKVLSRLG